MFTAHSAASPAMTTRSRTRNGCEESPACEPSTEFCPLDLLVVVRLPGWTRPPTDCTSIIFWCQNWSRHCAKLQNSCVLTHSMYDWGWLSVLFTLIVTQFADTHGACLKSNQLLYSVAFPHFQNQSSSSTMRARIELGDQPRMWTIVDWMESLRKAESNSPSEPLINHISTECIQILYHALMSSSFGITQRVSHSRNI